jgi:hypothetical protein
MDHDLLTPLLFMREELEPVHKVTTVINKPRRITMKSSPMYEVAVRKYYGMQNLLINSDPTSEPPPKTPLTPPAMQKINAPRRLSSTTHKIQSNSRNNSPTLSVISVHSDFSEPESTGTTFAFWAVFWTEVFFFFFNLIPL